MLCQNCQQRNANVNMRFRLNGQEKQLHLCQTCYESQKQHLSANMGPSLNLGGFGVPHSFPLDDMFKQMSQNQEEMTHKQNGQKPQVQGNGFLDQFGRNLNNMAKAGLIDPVIGRDEEIDRVIEILNRRNKNNPVLIGEAGVGKTAIAEGLALLIEEGSVPNKLKNKQVYLLDVASLSG